MSLNKLKDDADREEACELLEQECLTAQRKRRIELIEDCKRDFTDVFEKEKFVVSTKQERVVCAVYKKLEIDLQWPPLDECPLGSFFRFDVIINSAKRVDMIVVELIPEGHELAIADEVEISGGNSTERQLQASIAIVRNGSLCFRLIRNIDPTTEKGDPLSEESYDTFRLALAAVL